MSNNEPKHEIWDEIEKLASDMADDFEAKQAQAVSEDPLMRAMNSVPSVAMPSFEQITQTPQSAMFQDTDILQQEVNSSAPSPQADQSQIADAMDTSVDPFQTMGNLFGGGR